MVLGENCFWKTFRKNKSGPLLKNLVFRMRFREKKKQFFLTAGWIFFVWPLFEDVFFCRPQSMEKAIPKHRPAKNPASQKAKPSPTKNRFEFQNNKPKNGASAACGASVVGLKFVSICCWTLLGFLAELFCWLDSLMAYALGRFLPWIFGRWKNFFQKAGQKTFFQTPVIQKTHFHFCKKLCNKKIQRSADFFYRRVF